jgi:hypothetical protein
VDVSCLARTGGSCGYDRRICACRWFVRGTDRRADPFRACLRGEDQRFRGCEGRGSGACLRKHAEQYRGSSAHRHTFANLLVPEYVSCHAVVRALTLFARTLAHLPGARRASPTASSCCGRYEGHEMKKPRPRARPGLWTLVEAARIELASVNPTQSGLHA